MSKRALIYLRVSTHVQAEEGFSLPAQLDACRTYAARNGWRVVGEHEGDGQAQPFDVCDLVGEWEIDRGGLDGGCYDCLCHRKAILSCGEARSVVTHWAG